MCKLPKFTCHTCASSCIINLPKRTETHLFDSVVRHPSDSFRTHPTECGFLPSTNPLLLQNQSNNPHVAPAKLWSVDSIARARDFRASRRRESQFSSDVRRLGLVGWLVGIPSAIELSYRMVLTCSYHSATIVTSRRVREVRLHVVRDRTTIVSLRMFDYKTKPTCFLMALEGWGWRLLYI